MRDTLPPRVRLGVIEVQLRAGELRDRERTIRLQEQPFQILLMSGKVQPLLCKGRSQWLYQPVASPDGKHLAFQSQTWDSNVWMIDNF